MDIRANRVILPILAAVFIFLSGQILSAQSSVSSSSPAPGQAVQPAAPSAPASGLVALPSVAPVVDKAKPAVVNIFTVKTRQRGRAGRFFRNGPGGPGMPGMPGLPGPNDNLFEDFFNFPQQAPQVYRERALGSGFLIDKEGYIITNNHVVEGADEIKVKLDSSQSQELDATIVGRDPKTDLALIKVTKAGEYPFLKLGDSDKLRIGDWLVAIGNPYGLEHTVTTGILSARGRAIGAGPYDDFLQTDASINPGNSGGPLLNLDGDVVGINTMIVAGGNGIGFAIPTKLAGKIVDQLKAKGYVERGWIGVVIQPVTTEMTKTFGVDNTNGALIGDVVPDTPASRAGLKHGDIIVEFDGHPIKEFGELTAVVADTPIGKVVNVVVIRARQRTNLKLTVAKLVDESTVESGGTGPDIDLGLTLREITPDMSQRMNVPENTGLLVEQVAQNSLADTGGIRARDIILEVDQKPVKTVGDFTAIVRSHDKETPLLVWVRRGERNLYHLINLK
ncbi:MAG: Do family serine endopeptidase [Deltaproteobacteria bacterium]|jgi:serine protease Do|nr:Do family serine endopeptidase [Deltaproteobacteria bacterium]